MSMDLQNIHPVDAHVARRLRDVRKYRGITMVGLGKAVGVSGQQIQKYESGKNRISCSVLFDIANALKVSVDYFFIGATLDVNG